jgi:hypothetical protein
VAVLFWLSLLFRYKSTIILSDATNTALVGKPLILISTVVVLLVSHPNATAEDVNKVVLVPPDVYFETT